MIVYHCLLLFIPKAQANQNPRYERIDLLFLLFKAFIYICGELTMTNNA